MTDPADGDDAVVTVGRIGAAHGVRGDVFVHPFTDAPEERFAEGTVLRTRPDAAGPLTVAGVGASKGRTVLSFEGVDTREAAEALRGVELVVKAADRPALEDPDEYYTSDLIGLGARHIDGTELGPVTDVVDIAGADYLVVEVAGSPRLVPFVAAVVPEVDPQAGMVVVDPPEGLFEL